MDHLNTVTTGFIVGLPKVKSTNDVESTSFPSSRCLPITWRLPKMLPIPEGITYTVAVWVTSLHNSSVSEILIT